MAAIDDISKQRQDFFKQKRAQALGQVGAQEQEQTDALKRRFASLGAAGSGAALQAEQKARESGAAQRRAVETDIVGQELQAQAPEAQMKFQAEQAGLGRQFESEQQRLAREASMGEAEKQRGFQESMFGKQTAAQREGEAAQRAFQESMFGKETGAQAEQARLQREFQRGLSEQDIGFKRELAGIEQGNKLQELELARNQFELDKQTTEFNKRLTLAVEGLLGFGQRPTGETARLLGYQEEPQQTTQQVSQAPQQNQIELDPVQTKKDIVNLARNIDNLEPGSSQYTMARAQGREMVKQFLRAGVPKEQLGTDYTAFGFDEELNRLIRGA